MKYTIVPIIADYQIPRNLSKHIRCLRKCSLRYKHDYLSTMNISLQK